MCTGAVILVGTRTINGSQEIQIRAFMLYEYYYDDGQIRPTRSTTQRQMKSIHSRPSSASSIDSMSDAEAASTPMSSAGSVMIDGREAKRRKLEVPNSPIVDRMAPVFLKISFKRSDEPEEPDTKLEDDATYLARPWQERSTMIPLLLAFRVQFHDLFIGVPDLGPQDIEEGIEGETPSKEVQELMCGILTLAANRLKPVEYPQYNRPLNDCVALHFATRGDPAWEGANPLAGMRRFPDLSPDDRLRLMYCLLDWALTDSKVVRDRIEEAYKNRTAPRANTHNPYELKMIGRDDRKHAYYLLKGTNTRFRLYIQTDVNTLPCRWYSICSTLEELRTFTSDLSNTCKTVRGRKIVDELASIHIPEVERAEQARAHILQKRSRAEYERNRRATNTSDVFNVPSERGTRTRGKRVDYNNMLQGQGEDEDGNSSGRRSRRDASPDLSSAPQSTRSGRMLKRPRAWEDNSPENDFSAALANSLADSNIGTIQADADLESAILILKYNKELFKNWQHRSFEPYNPSETGHSVVTTSRPDNESVEVPATLNLPEQATTDNCHRNVSTAVVSLGAVANHGPSDSSTAQQTDGHAPSAQDSRLISNASEQKIRGPDQSRTHRQETGKSQTQNDSKASGLPRTNTNEARSLEVHRPVRSLIIATIRERRLDANFMKSILLKMVDHASTNAITKIDVLLHTSPSIRDYMRSASVFKQLQKLLSTLYVNSAKLAEDKGVALEFTVIFNDWCGYNLAQEDFHWGAIGGFSDDLDLLSGFAKFHRDTYPSHQAPEVLTVDAITLVPAQSDHLPQQAQGREYQVVALGGTFDHLHAGHKILLTMAAWLAQERVLVGITDDALLVNKKHKEVMEDITKRTQNVRDFMYRIKRGIEYQLVRIVDVAGPTATDATLQALVASRETEAGSAEIREVRMKNNLPPMDIFFIDVIGPEGEVAGEEMSRLKLSSTAIREKLASKL